MKTYIFFIIIPPLKPDFLLYISRLESKPGKRWLRAAAVREFACCDGTDTVFVSLELVTALQKIRDHFGRAVVINSGYRAEAHNKKVGGAAYSQHKYSTPAKFAACAEPLLPGKGGIGIYSSFIHVDCGRQSPAGGAERRNKN